jgi:hypothetical protein
MELASVFCKSSKIDRKQAYNWCVLRLYGLILESEFLRTVNRYVSVVSASWTSQALRRIFVRLLHNPQVRDCAQGID